MSRIVLYGFGGFGCELLAPLRHLNDGDIIFVDDNPAADEFDGVPVMRPAKLSPGDRYIVAVADGKTRQLIEKRCADAGLVAYSFIAPGAFIGADVEIGEGAVLCSHTIVTAKAKIGRQFQANIYSYVAHDCVIGNYVTFAPKVCCNGNVQIGDGAYIGTGAVIKQGSPGKPLRIGAGAVVGMGAVVTKDVPERATVVGNPARILSKV